MRREVRPFVVAYKGEAVTFALPGCYPEEGDDGVHIGDDMSVADAALHSVKENRGPAVTGKESIEHPELIEELR